MEELSRGPNDPVRLHALALLIRHGEKSRLSEIVSDATEANDVRVRAEAVRVLGELDAGRHHPILSQVILEDWEEFDGRHVPVAEEAAFGLARLGTPEALTAILQASLLGPHPVWAAAEHYFEMLFCGGVSGDDLVMPIVNWRKGRHWR